MAFMALTPVAAFADHNPKSTKLPGFPLPLHWGMSKQEIKTIVAARGFHLAEKSRRLLQKRRYSTSKSYEWAAIKEETLKFLEQRRFVVFHMDESDRLTRVSLKLLNKSAAVHVAEHINISTNFTRNYGEAYKKESVKMSGNLGTISRFAWRFGNQTIVETEFYELNIGGKKDLTAYVNFFWDRP